MTEAPKAAGPASTACVVVQKKVQNSTTTLVTDHCTHFCAGLKSVQLPSKKYNYEVESNKNSFWNIGTDLLFHLAGRLGRPMISSAWPINHVRKT
jgi:hypothetical protein